MHLNYQSADERFGVACLIIWHSCIELELDTC